MSIFDESEKDIKISATPLYYSEIIKSALICQITMFALFKPIAAEI